MFIKSTTVTVTGSFFSYFDRSHSIYWTFMKLATVYTFELLLINICNHHEFSRKMWIWTITTLIWTTSVAVFFSLNYFKQRLVYFLMKKRQRLAIIIIICFPFQSDNGMQNELVNRVLFYYTKLVRIFPWWRSYRLLHIHCACSVGQERRTICCLLIEKYVSLCNYIRYYYLQTVRAGKLMQLQIHIFL